ncbi:MAG: T9SS type A sorting domain-containing protein [bacterium]|nr:T9SS type A sorting domain-containing protein [bacterium]
MKPLILLFVLTLTTSSFSQLTNGLIAHYNFNNSNTADFSGNNYHVALNTASPSTDRFGNTNCAFYFDGSEYMEVNQSSAFGTPNVSVCVWFKSTDNQHARIIALPYLESSSWSILYHHPSIAANSIGFTNTTSTPTQFSSYTAEGNVQVNDGQWHFMVGMRDASTQTLSLYIDCDLVYTAQYQGSPYAPDQNLAIGRFNQASGRYFTGDIDDIRIYNRTLSESEINMLCAEEDPLADVEIISDDFTPQVSLYPNPAVETVNIVSDSPLAQVNIYNNAGELILQDAAEGQKVDISGLSNGVYSVMIQTQMAEVAVEKLVICR